MSEYIVYVGETVMVAGTFAVCFDELVLLRKMGGEPSLVHRNGSHYRLVNVPSMIG